MALNNPSSIFLLMHEQTTFHIDLGNLYGKKQELQWSLRGQEGV